MLQCIHSHPTACLFMSSAWVAHSSCMSWPKEWRLATSWYFFACKAEPRIRATCSVSRFPQISCSTSCGIAYQKMHRWQPSVSEIAWPVEAWCLYRSGFHTITYGRPGVAIAEGVVPGRERLPNSPPANGTSAPVSRLMVNADTRPG